MTATAFEPAFRPSSSMAAFVIDEEMTEAGGDLDLDDAVHGAFDDLDDRAGELVACGELHDVPFRSYRSANTNTLAGELLGVQRWLLCRLVLRRDLLQADEEAVLVDDVAAHEGRNQARSLLDLLRRT